jgi:predicted dehydrogenase
MASQIRIGIIGCARILNAHLRGFKILQENGYGDLFQITALCARKEEDALRFRKRGEGPPPRPAPVAFMGDPLNAPQSYISDLHPDQEAAVFTDYAEMLKSGLVDAVCIYTGHDNHHSIAIDALKSGMHVEVEKPMAISVKAAQRMTEIADEASKVLAIDENVAFSPGTHASKWVVDSGLIGQVQMLYRGVMGFPDPRPDLVAARTPWRQSKLGAGGGVAIDLGVHFFNGVRTIVGPVASVSAEWCVLEPVRKLMSDDDSAVVDEIENQVDDAFMTNLTFENGAIGHMAVARSTHGKQIGVPGGTNVFGTKGTISGSELFADDGSSEKVSERFAREASKDLQESISPKGIADAFALQQLDFLQAVSGGRTPRMSGEEGTIDLALSYAILESGLARRAVTLKEMLSGEVDAWQRDINEHYKL